MRLAITGGTGFAGRHLAERFAAEDVVIVSRRTGIDVGGADVAGGDVSGVGGDAHAVDALTRAFAGCDVVAHFAGINREIGDQTYERVHVRGTASVIEAAKRAGVKKIVMLSFLRARPDCDSAYHESKFAAEELIRASGLDFTILKAGLIYGRGDHLIDHLSRTVQTIPLFASVGLRERPIRPIPIGDLVDIAVAALAGRMPHATVAVTGAEELLLSDAVKRVARVVGRRVWVIPAPLWAHSVLAQLTEWTMTVPLIAKAQVRMLAEGVVDAAPPAAEVPADLTPSIRFTDDQIRRALPDAGKFSWNDLRFAQSGP